MKLIIAIFLSTIVIQSTKHYLIGFYEGMNIKSIDDSLAKRLALLAAFTISTAAIISAALLVHFIFQWV